MLVFVQNETGGLSCPGREVVGGHYLNSLRDKDTCKSGGESLEAPVPNSECRPHTDPTVIAVRKRENTLIYPERTANCTDCPTTACLHVHI